MRTRSRVAAGITLAFGIAMVAACGGSSSSSPSTNANTLVIQNNTISPSALTGTRGTQITILNSDSLVHEMTSDPHPEHTDCPELNQIGFLNPAQSKQSGNLNTVRRCGLHDHRAPNTASLKATITIQ